MASQKRVTSHIQSAEWKNQQPRISSKAIIQDEGDTDFPKQKLKEFAPLNQCCKKYYKGIFEWKGETNSDGIEVEDTSSKKMNISGKNQLRNSEKWI